MQQKDDRKVQIYNHLLNKGYSPCKKINLFVLLSLFANFFFQSGKYKTFLQTPEMETGESGQADKEVVTSVHCRSAAFAQGPTLPGLVSTLPHQERGAARSS